MALLKKATGKQLIDDSLLDSDSDFTDSDDDDKFKQLRKGNEADYDIDKRIMARYGTNVDQKKSLTNYYIKFAIILVILILIPSEIVLRNIIFKTEVLAIRNYQQVIANLGRDVETAFRWF